MTEKFPERVVSYNYAEFLQRIIDLSKQGYKLNTENKHYPEAFMGRYVANMDAPFALVGEEDGTLGDKAPDGFEYELETPPAVVEPIQFEMAPAASDETVAVEVTPGEFKPIYRAGPGRPRKQK